MPRVNVTPAAVERYCNKAATGGFPMHRSLPLLALLLATTLVHAAYAREASPNDLLPVGDQAFLPAPPSTVADNAERGTWSHDGKHVLAWRNAIQFPFNLMGEPTV